MSTPSGAVQQAFKSYAFAALDACPTAPCPILCGAPALYAADVYSWGLTVLCFFCDDGRDARRTVRAVREASAAGQARGELGWGVGRPSVGGGSVGDGMMLPNRWGRRCPFPGTLRDVVARTLRLDPETRPTAAEIVKTLLGARN